MGGGDSDSDEDKKAQIIKNIVTKDDSSDSDASSDGEGPDHEHLMDQMLASNTGRSQRFQTNLQKLDRPSEVIEKKDSNSEDEAEDGGGNMDFSSDSEEEKEAQSF